MNLLLYDRVLKKKTHAATLWTIQIRMKERHWAFLVWRLGESETNQSDVGGTAARPPLPSDWSVYWLFLLLFCLRYLSIGVLWYYQLFLTYTFKQCIQNMIRICGCPSLLMTSSLILRKCEGAKFVGWSLYTLSVNFKEIFLLDTAVGRVFTTFVTHTDKIRFNMIYIKSTWSNIAWNKSPKQWHLPMYKKLIPSKYSPYSLFMLTITFTRFLSQIYLIHDCFSNLRFSNNCYDFTKKKTEKKKSRDWHIYFS